SSTCGRGSARWWPRLDGWVWLERRPLAFAPSPASGGRPGWGRARSARRMARRPACPHPSPSGQAQRALRSGGPHGSAVKAGLPHPRERGREHNTIELHSSRERDLPRHTAVLRLIPPPPRWRPLLRLAPTSLRERLMARALSHALAPEHIGSALDDIAGRRLSIEVSDLGLHCVLRWRGGRLHAV